MVSQLSGLMVMSWGRLQELGGLEVAAHLEAAQVVEGLGVHLYRVVHEGVGGVEGVGPALGPGLAAPEVTLSAAGPL